MSALVSAMGSPVPLYCATTTWSELSAPTPAQHQPARPSFCCLYWRDTPLTPPTWPVACAVRSPNPTQLYSVSNAFPAADAPAPAVVARLSPEPARQPARQEGSTTLPPEHRPWNCLPPIPRTRRMESTVDAHGTEVHPPIRSVTVPRTRSGSPLPRSTRGPREPPVPEADTRQQNGRRAA